MEKTCTPGLYPKPTGYGGAKEQWVYHNEPVLQTSASHALSTDQDERLPLEGRHPSYLLIDLQLMTIKF